MLNAAAATRAMLSAMTPRAALAVAGEVRALEAEDADEDREHDEDRAGHEERRLGLVLLAGVLAGGLGGVLGGGEDRAQSQAHGRRRAYRTGSSVRDAPGPPS